MFLRIFEKQTYFIIFCQLFLRVIWFCHTCSYHILTCTLSQNWSFWKKNSSVFPVFSSNIAKLTLFLCDDETWKSYFTYPSFIHFDVSPVSTRHSTLLWQAHLPSSPILTGSWQICLFFNFLEQHCRISTLFTLTPKLVPRLSLLFLPLRWGERPGRGWSRERPESEWGKNLLCGRGAGCSSCWCDKSGAVRFKSSGILKTTRFIGVLKWH